MKYMKKVVLSCIILCAAYLPLYLLCSLHGVLLPDILTDKWFTVFGTELAAVALIKITEVITEKLTKKKGENEV